MRKEEICIKIRSDLQLEIVNEFISESMDSGKPYFGPTPCYLLFSGLTNCWVFSHEYGGNLEVRNFAYLSKQRMEIILPKLSYEKLKEAFDTLFEKFQNVEKELKEREVQVLEEKHMPGIYADQAPAHYDNSKGSLYKVATERGWNPYLFDIVKRLERGGKKDPIEQEIDKTIYVLKLWKDEIKN